MLHILAWLVVLTAVLFALGEAMRPWRSRRWFKLLFLPGVLLAIGVQSLAARLCAEAPYKSSPLHEGEAAFFMQKTELPPVAGASFVLVSHALIFAFFAGVVFLLESLSALDPFAIELPSLYPSSLSEGRLPDAGADDAAAPRVVGGVRFVPYFLLLYFVIPVFANLRLRSREYVAAGLTLLVLVLVHFSDVLGLGFPFVSRGWMARLLHFPPWWGTFSLYVLTAVAGLIVALIARAVGKCVNAPEERRRGGIKVKLGHVGDERVPRDEKEQEVIYE